MARAAAALLAMVVLVGCNAPPTAINPFPGPTRIPPPGTGSAVPGPGPYYQGTPVPGTAAPPGQVPMPGPAPTYGVPQGSATPPGAAAAPLAFVRPADVQPVRPVADEAPVHHWSGEPTVRVPTDNLPAVAQIAPPRQTLPPVDRDRPAAFTATANSRPTPSPGTLPVSMPGAATAAAPRTLPVSTPTASPTPTSATRSVTLPATTVPYTPTTVMITAPGQQPTRAQATSFAAAQTETIAARPETVEITDLPIPSASRSRGELGAAGTVAASGASAGSVQQASFASSEAAQQGMPVTEMTSRYGYDPQYRWLTGKLEHLASIDQWKLRYIRIDGETDEYGGSVALANPEALQGLKPGDFVKVEGAITAPQPDDALFFSPTYIVHSVKPVLDD